MSFATRFPVHDREEWGGPYWYVTHNILATMSPKPKAQEKRDVATLIKLLFKRLPCEECRDHALDYLKKHPMDNSVLKDPKSAFFYSCKMHNEKSIEKGKTPVDCERIYDPEMKSSQKCYDCFDPLTVAADIGSTAEQYKQIATEYFGELCRADGIPIPEIRFNPCPDFPSTSCGEFYRSGNNVIHLNPSNMSPKIIAHEYHHYRDFVKNNKTTFSEAEANEFAEGKIQEHFSYNNKPMEQSKVLEEKIVAKYEADSRMVVGAYDPVRPQFQPMTPGTSPMSPGVMTNYRESFPMYQQYVETHKVNEVSEAEQMSAKVGVLSSIDSFYKKPGEITGLPADDLNLFHTSLIIKNIISTLIQTNTTKLGSMMFSAMLGITIFLTTTVMKKNIRHRDKQLLHLLAAGFTWDMVTYINPKNAVELKEQLGKVVGNIKKGHPFSKDVTSQIFETPKTWKQKRTAGPGLFGRKAGGGVGPIITGGTPANVYAATTGDPGVDAVRSMVSMNAGSGTPIMDSNMTPAEVGASGASDTTGAVIVDANNNIIGTQYTIGDQNVYVPKPVSEVEQMYSSFYTQAAEGNYMPQGNSKLETNNDYLYKSHVNPYSFKVSY